MKIACFSPLPPVRSGIADHSAELLPYLADKMEITLFADEPEAVAMSLQKQFNIRPISAYPQEQWQYDLPLYHMGNSRHHEAIYRLSLRYPGLVVLHEPGLHHFIADRTIGQGKRISYIRELAYVKFGSYVNHLADLQPDDVYRLPLSNRLIGASLGMVVHSRYAQGMVQEIRPSLPTRVIPELMLPQTGERRLPADMGAPDDAIIFASLGQVTAHKQTEFALRAFQRLRQSNPRAYFLIVGEPLPAEAESLAACISELNLADFVYQTGYVASLADFVSWLLLADVVLSLRQPTIGETSAAALRAMGAAKPLIVFDQGWYGEIADEAALKVRPLDEAGLLGAMQRLAGDADLRRRMGLAGLAMIEADYGPARVAGAYADFIGYLVEMYGRFAV